MPQARGANAQIIIQEETTYKTDPASPDCSLVPFSTCELRLARNTESSSLIKKSRNPQKPNRGNTEISGPISTELQAYIGLLYKATLGNVTTTGSGPYTHVFTVGESVPSLLIEKGFTDIDQYFKYQGCKVNRMALAVTASGAQKLDFDFLGAKETASGTGFDSTPTDLGTATFDGFSLATLEEGGAAIADVLSVDNLAFENGNDGDQYLLGGGGERADIPEGMVKVSGTLKARFSDLTLYNKAVAHTNSSLKLGWVLGTGDGSAGNESIEFYIPELVFSPAAPGITGPKGIVIDLPFEGFYEDSSEASALQITLMNTQATI